MRWPTALWQRNTIGAVVTAAALVVLGTVTWWPQWSEYRATTTPPSTTPPGATATVDGQTWRVESVRHLATSPGAFGPPAGTSLAVITLARTGDGLPMSCGGVLTDGERRWTSQLTDVARVAEGATTLCSQPGPLQMAFTIPAGTAVQALDVTAPDGRILARFQL